MASINIEMKATQLTKIMIDILDIFIQSGTCYNDIQIEHYAERVAKTMAVKAL
jgi:hypothetical protein